MEIENKIDFRKRSLTLQEIKNKDIAYKYT